MKVLLADGSLQTVSANENKDLFNLVVSGYGVFGVIVDNAGRKYKPYCPDGVRRPCQASRT